VHAEAEPFSAVEILMARSRSDRTRRKAHRHCRGDPALALWRQWRDWTVWVERHACDRATPDRDLDAVVRKAFAAEHRLAVTPAASLAGIRGKLAVYAYYARDAHPRGLIEDRLVASVIDDLDRLAGGDGRTDSADTAGPGRT
jgi:hypothetical protein